MTACFPLDDPKHCEGWSERSYCSQQALFGPAHAIQDKLTSCDALVSRLAAGQYGHKIINPKEGGHEGQTHGTRPDVLRYLCAARTVKPSTVILHARADDVVPFADSEELVRNSGMPASALVEVGTDHRLADRSRLR